MKHASSVRRDRQWPRFCAGAGAYRGWLIDRGSLTARIAHRCPDVEVKLIFQGLRRPDRDELFLFDGHSEKRVLVREVLLCCRGTPVVFAHSVLDPDELRRRWRSVAKLGTRPLGAALFADPRVRRYPLRQRKLGRNHELRRRLRSVLARTPASLWARRSLFSLRDSPILVTEVFLPDILLL